MTDSSVSQLQDDLHLSKALNDGHVPQAFITCAPSTPVAERLDYPLAEAELASSGEGDVYTANGQRKRKLRQRQMLIIAVSVLLVAIVIGVSVPLATRSSDTSSSLAKQPTTPRCFAFSFELESAVDDYLAGGDRRNQALSDYGSPIGSWCVDAIDGMDELFSVERNPSAIDFDEPLSEWRVHNVISMRQMFSGAAMFNQAIGT